VDGSVKKPFNYPDIREMQYTRIPPLPTFYSSANRPQPHRYIYSGTPDNLRQRRDCAVERSSVGRVGFSGQGSIGVLRRKGERKSDFTPNAERLYQPSHVEYQHFEPDGTSTITRISLIDVPPPSYLVKSFDPSQRLEYLSNFKIRQQFRRSLERLDASEKPKRVARGLTSRGKKVIADGCALLERKYGARRLGFYTLTCPFTDSWDIQHFNDSFPEIVRRYMQELKRIYERNQVRFSYVGVYEIQTKRLAATGDAALHLHYVSPATDTCGGFLLCHREITALFGRIVTQVTGVELNRNPRVDCRLVKRSAAGYLAKYFSKGQPADAAGGRNGAIVSLSSWYSVSRNLLVATRRSTAQLPGHINDDILKCCAEGRRHPMCKSITPIHVMHDDRKVFVGCWFVLEASYLEDLRRLYYPQVEHFL